MQTHYDNLKVARNAPKEVISAAYRSLAKKYHPDTDFCLPEAAATRSINESPEVFLALLYWLRKGGAVQIGSEEHRRLLGCFTMLAWFEPGNARARQESLRIWISSAENDPASSLWSPECLHNFFTREERNVPFFPQPSKLLEVIMKGTFDAANYTYENIPKAATSEFWSEYSFLPEPSEEKGELREQQLHSNFFTLLNKLRPNRTLLIYAQREYIKEKLQGFGQWEMTLKDTHCPWDWDHIYPSAYHRKNPQQPYRDWHNAIGNLRAIGLSENRSDGADWPSEKLAGRTADEGTKLRHDSFISEELWNQEMKELAYRYDALRDQETAKSMCIIVLKRMLAIYEEWYREFLIGDLMNGIKNVQTNTANETPVVA